MSSPLPGTGLIGFPYNITGYFANGQSVNLSAALFTFPNTQGLGEITLQGTVYTYPADQCAVTVLDQTFQVSTEYAEAQQAAQTYSFGVEGSYRSAMFGASVRAGFSLGYGSSALMKSIAQRSIVRTYELTLPYTLTQLQGMLSPQANSDINGDTDPDKVIATYGTHVLAKAIFGGLNEYSQSVSMLNARTTAQAEVEVNANYLAYNGKATGATTTDRIGSSSQSNAVLQVFGGDPVVAGDTYQAWAASLNQGNWVMIDFPKDEGALIPLASLATAPARQQALTAAMNRALQQAGSPVPATYALQWNASAEKVACTVGATPDITLRLATTSQVVVGYGASVTSKKISRAVLHVLDLSTNTTTEIWANSDHHMEKDVNIPLSVQDSYGNPLRGVAAVGVGADADGNNMSGLTVWYQELNPADNSANPTFLSGDTRAAKAGTASTEVSYKADPGWIITEIGLGMDNNKNTVKVLHVKTAPLQKVVVKVHTVG